jgi:hypothetical protein
MSRVDKLAKQVALYLTPDLLKGTWGKHSLAGHCYVASECFFHLIGGKKAGFKPMFIKHENSSHWWVKGPNGEIVDITAKQFNTPVPYNKSIGKGFLTKEPSKRARVLIGRLRLKSGI